MGDDLIDAEWSNLEGERFVVTGPSAAPGYMNINVYNIHNDLIRLGAVPAEYIRKYAPKINHEA